MQKDWEGRSITQIKHMCAWLAQVYAIDAAMESNSSIGLPWWRNG